MMNLKITLGALFGLLLLISCAETTASTRTESTSAVVAAKELTPVDSLPPASAPNVKGETELRRITSQVLGYDLQYWV